MQALKSLFFLIFLLSSHLIVAQQDTIYFDVNWEVTNDISEMHYYRIPNKKGVDGKYFIQDYFANGNLQMEGYSLTEDASILDGKVTWYLKDGSPYNSTHYVNGIREGEEINYFPSGKIQSIGINKDDSRWSGTFPYYENVLEIIEYENGESIAIYSFYQDQKTYSEKTIIDPNNPKFNHQFFYDQKGNQIAEAEYVINHISNDFPIKGTKIYFQYDVHFFATKPIGRGEFKQKGDLIEVTTTLDGYNKKFKGTIGSTYSGQIYFYQSGELFTYKDGVRNGKTISGLNSLQKNVEGIYKDDFPYSGDFYDFYPNTISHYKDGRLDGLQQTFDENNQLIEQFNYKDGQLDGDRLTTNEFTGEQYHATYKEGVPINGQVFGYLRLDTYKDSFKIEERNYENGGELESITVLKPDENYETLYKVFYRNGKTYRLDYRNGLPYSGIEWGYDDSFVTLTNGEVTGPYQFKVLDFIEQGEYVNYKKEGLINYKIGSEEFSCLFKDDQPIKGITYEPYYQNRVTYENGKKNGPFTKKDYSYYYDYDSLSMVFQDDIPVGTVNYFYEQKLVDQGEFKNGLPYNGTFYSDDTLQVFMNGELNKRTIISKLSGYRVDKFFEQGNLNKEVVSNIDDPNISFELEYKDGKPWNGTQFKENERDFKLTELKNGVLNGYDARYYSGDKLVYNYNYLNGKKDGKQFYQRLDSVLYESEYKDGVPINGLVVDIDTDGAMQVIEYENKNRVHSFIIQEEYYDSTYVQLAECDYKNNLPLEGSVLIELDDQFIVNQYNNGNLKTTLIDAIIGSFINHEQGIDSKAIANHKPNSDSIDYKGSFPKVLIDYTNHSKSSGKATYYEDKDSIGYITFDQFQITDLDIQSSYEWNSSEFQYKKTEDNQFVSDVIFLKENPNLMLRAKLNPVLKNPVFLSLYDYNKLVDTNNPDQPYEYFVEAFSDKPIASFYIKNGQIDHGVYLYQDYDNEPNIYTIQYFKDGKEIKEEKMTLEEFIQRNQEQ